MSLNASAFTPAGLAPVDFRGRRVLLIVAPFFGYDKEIAARLTERGAVVTVYDDRPSGDNINKVMNRVHPLLVAGRARRHVERIIDECGAKIFDDILVVKGESFSPVLLKKLFAAFPRTRKTFYMWDSFRNAKGSREKMACFDRCLTFDPIDASNTSGLILRPLFFVPRYSRAEAATPDIDVLFVGTVHTDRFRVLTRLAHSLPKNVGHYYFLYFPARFIYTVRRFLSPQFWGSASDQFSFTPLSHAQNSALYARAKVIVDVERAVQTGLTMRTFEVLASGKKLITTNPAIRKSELYDPANVCVIDRHNPVVPEAFFASLFRPVDPGLLGRYSLDGWLDDVLGQTANPQ